MGKVRVALIGVGNCASSLVQGVTYERLEAFIAGREVEYHFEDIKGVKK
jgi:myo-inositol-1-phosphate synthase